ncbi:uncharacterized protein At5g39865 [Brachypodium distachyon]|uniref:Glutaredoxin domain-containing protein n=1 Tax=Brachypodium distachyon TaxID=15368 RepID=I1GZK7_BRADI|nr:uncharacterized protein At5g39865 [Brachypodium distachyon]KQK18889.1 hypothetical protein BRADI_1g45280v3 [Brachypodium distachyon]|eukprot:XP_014751955.1 uncharacterized protein At5g39865 [Brachypodium distachyon]
MGCKGSKHSLLYGGGAPESGHHVARHSVALRSSTLGTLSLDRAVSFAAAEGMTTTAMAAAAAKSVEEESAGRPGRAWATTWSVSNGWLFPASSSPQMEPGTKQRQIRQPPRTPTKTPARDPEEINVWELMDGLHDDDTEEEEECDGVQEEPSPEFDPDVLSAFRDALDELSPPPSPPPREAAADAVKKNVFQEQSVDGGGNPEEKKPSPSQPPPPPESARRVVVYTTSLRGIRQTYEDCWAAATILSSYGVRVDERDLSMHAGFKDELRDALALAAHGCRLPQVFVDGRHLGGAEEVRRMHESGELADALEACDAAPCAGAGKEGGFAAAESCGGCGGARFVPCDVCSGSCKVFVVEDEDGAGAFRRCPECNENGLLRCHVCY